MLRLRLATIAAGLLVACGSPAPAQPAVRTVPPGTEIVWSHADHPDPAPYRSGPVTLTLRWELDREFPDMVRPMLKVDIPGYAPAELEGSTTTGVFEHRATVGRWDAQRPYVLFESYTGGAHCCNAVQVVIPEESRLAVVDLGSWDGDRIGRPEDVDGDGRVDFLFVDNAFLYAFASYAESFAPPQILNIVDGEPVDVSARPGFRPLFEEAMADARRACIDPEGYANGACAAYVAAAARVGRLDQAWTEMLQHYDRESEWGLDQGCRSALVDGECPEGAAIRFANYPDALRHFLIERGYIAR